jgi:hypothetical protein
MSKLQAGLGITTITPPMEVEMSGYGYYLNRRCDGVMADLYSKALVLDDGDTRVAIVANDLIGVDRDITSRMRALVEANTGIPLSNVLLACSHTHSGPATIFLRGCGEVDQPYVEMLIRLMASAVMMANSALEPVTMRVGSGHLDNLSHNRVVQGGPIDPEVGVVSFYRENVSHRSKEAALVAVLTNFSCHAVTLGGGNKKISPDFCGVTANIIESVFLGSKMLFLQGSCGDVNPRMRGGTEPTGTLLAGEVLKTLVTSDEVENVTLSAASKLIGLPLIPPDISEVRRTLEVNKAKLESGKAQGGELIEARFLTDWAESMLTKLSDEPETKLTTEIQVIKLGNIVLACNPSELFTEFALKIKQQANMKAFNVGYANDFVGYIPDRGDFERKGYAAARVPLICDNFPFAVDVGDVLVEEMISLIQK